MSVESSKTLGGVGALLVAIGTFIPLLALVGIILVLIALKQLADNYKDNDIFQNGLYGFIFGIIGIIALTLVIIGLIFGLAIFPVAPGIGALSIIGGVIIALVLAFIFNLLSAFFYRKSFTILAQKTGENMFDTAGLILLIGAILTIILVGIILTFVAWILVAVAFFSMRASVAPATPTSPPPLPPNETQQ